MCRKLDQCIERLKRVENETNALNSAQALNKKLSGQIDDLTNGLEDTNNKCKHLDKDYKKLLDDLHATQDALSDENALHDQHTAETGV